ncbi:transcriptional regulator, LysR family protein [Vibrio mediterranei AK1]|uniref:LysR family transcriptional regulator n=1 Tax=Vibrio mediterranei TaxID=689 RepID=UPI0001540193|nr:LysR family transcriptional regulator [Vibrio mediterranei]EDL54354.1 transcriptional regulator, LysR family protein [Vibrio mediterranei AK1]
MEPIETRLLRSFVAIAETGSLKKASVRVGKSTSTLSRWLSEFEDHIGYQVFNRKSNGLVLELNKEGQVLLPKAKNVVATLMRFTSQVSVISIEGSPTAINLSFHQYVENECTAEVVASLKSHYPETQINLISEPQSDIQDLLLSKSVDFALTTVPGNVFPDIGGQIVGEEQVMLVVAAGHPLCNESNIGFQQLSPYTLIVPHHLQNEGYQQYLNPLDVVGTSDFQLSAECARKGVGVAYLPAHAARRYILSKELVELNTNWEEFAQSLPLILLYRLDYPYHDVKHQLTTKLREWFVYQEQ